MLTALVLLLTALVPPPTPVTIDVLSTEGTGCLPGTTAVAPSPDRTAFTVTYSDFLVQGKGSEAKKDCRITLRVNHPQGYTYGIAATDYRGFANLDKGAGGEKRAKYFFPGMPARNLKHALTGPMSDDWQSTDRPSPGDVIHGPCKEKKPLTIDAELRIKAKDDTSFITMDSTDSSVTATFKLSWKKC
ncbi:hypothetical protein Lesp02_39110 [Lentzea sp. NBRC 105346]|uniref:DUF4360 domain-containing protein n=1 Tax=Lentzea sp. NBRC 105346 TaxID=3032205 RepID=UPI0024A3502C|nr:DUF4360 domain-containing protein [Lentzea sp. NBRC 105346]GLZ31723.1 hypothetical protein Lesp02_39110 [Lentzea sp. NBRC 105346]